MDRRSHKERRVSNEPTRWDRRSQREAAPRNLNDELERTSYRLYYPLVAEWEHPDGVRFDQPRD